MEGEQQQAYENFTDDAEAQKRSGSGIGGKTQLPQFHDVPFSILFLVHLGAMGYFLHVGLSNYDEQGGEGLDYRGLASTVSTCGLFAAVLTTLSLFIIMSFAEAIIKMALYFSLAVSLYVTIQGFLSGQIFVGILGAIGLFLGACYVYFVLRRVPFAAANMKTAVSAVKANQGLLLLTFLFLIIAFGWIIWWSIASAGALNAGWYPGYIFLFLLSYFWTQQVIQNTLHVTAVGVVGTWWYKPEEASSCCSPAVRSSFGRSLSYSFGSICMGSLAVSILNALQGLVRMARNNGKLRWLLCCLDCCLGLIGNAIEYFNKWAYVYCGIYGYGFLDAGRNVKALFEQRGWTAIINDDLVDKTLSMLSVAIGFLTGIFGMWLASAHPEVFGGIGFDESPGTVGFIAGLLVGFLLSRVTLGVVASAVDTVVVCFAEAPAEFEANHPEQSAEMRDAWKQVYPEECASIL